MLSTRRKKEYKASRHHLEGSFALKLGTVPTKKDITSSRAKEAKRNYSSLHPRVATKGNGAGLQAKET